MTDGDTEEETAAPVAGPSVPRNVEGPPTLGAWLGQTHNETGATRLEWQQSCASHIHHRLREVVPPKIVFNATVQEHVRDENAAPFSITRLRTSAHLLDTRNFDSYVPHETLLDTEIQNPVLATKRTVFPGSAICAEVGVVPLAETAVTHFYVVGTVTGRRANELSVLLPQDSVVRSKRWSAAPVPEREAVVVTYPTPILDVKVHSTPKGNIFGIRTQSIFTLLSFIRQDDIRGLGDIRHFHWQKPLHLDLECFGDRGISDFALNPFPLRNEHLRSDALIVDEIGGIWQTRQGAEEMVKSPMISPFAAVEQLRACCPSDGRSKFARITYGRGPETAVVAREDAVRIFDLEDHALDYTLFALLDNKTKILDMAQPIRQFPSTTYRVICTSDEVVWLDLEKPGLPALRCKHFRDNDETLSLYSAYCDGLYHTFLWSRKTSAMTVYTHPAIGPAQLVLPPYDIPPPVPNMRRSGVSSIQTSMKQRYKAAVPEALILLESAADGAVYQRELISEASPKLPSDVVDKERVEHRRIAADQPLSRVPLEDPKRFRVAHLFMLYNRLFSTQPSLHRTYTGTSSLDYVPGKGQDDLMQIPMEVTQAANSHSSQADVIATSTSTFTSADAIDSSAILPEAIMRELEQLSLASKVDFTYAIEKDLLGHVSTDPSNPSQMSQILQALYACSRHRKTAEGCTGTSTSATEMAHRFACDQVAVDLALSRNVLAAATPLSATTSSTMDHSMSSYERLADLPNIEYGYFKPVRADGTIPTSDAARALLSEWTLGANPAIRPPFKNPYDQRMKDEKVANIQLKAFKTRIAQGVGVSASQPLPGVFRASRPRSVGLPMLADVEDVAETSRKPQDQYTPQVQSQIQAEARSSTQTETQPMPFTQMLPGAHGGRPAKKKKKRAGGF